MTEDEAKKIMGKNFIGRPELLKIAADLGLSKKMLSAARVPAIPFSGKLLKSVSASHILILGLPKVSVKKGLTLSYLRSRFMPDSVRSPRFYNQDWYLKEDFFRNRTPRFRWYLIRKSVKGNSRGKMPAIIIKGMHRGERLPEAIEAAYAFFANYFWQKEYLWPSDFIWCGDKDHNGDQIYVGRYFDPSHINRNGFSVHRYLRIRNFYGSSPIID